MKFTTKSALFIGGVLIAMQAAQASAAAPVPGWYGTLGAGVNSENDAKSKATAGTTTFKFDPDYDVAGSIGFEWRNGWRAEVEAFHSLSIVKDRDGSLANTDFFANALYDFDICPWVTPYIGGGIGGALIDANNIGPETGGGHLNDGSTKFAFQGIVGFEVPIDNQWAVQADYRYIQTVDPAFLNSTGGNARTENSSHNILVSVRYNFAPPPPPVAPKATQAPPVRTAKPMAKAAVAPIPQTFQVFFDYDKSDLTDEAKKILASAAQEYESGKYIRVEVTGHTDTKGTKKYNQKLSERRAASVKAELDHLGVASEVVVAKGVGKNGLLVPTNDQVREAQNRRAEIVLDKK